MLRYRIGNERERDEKESVRDIWGESEERPRERDRQTGKIYRVN